MDEKKPDDVGIEEHYTPAQIAKALCVSTDTVRRMLENEPGVLCITTLNRTIRGAERNHKTLRVPASVWRRIHEKWTVKAGTIQQKPRRRSY